MPWSATSSDLSACSRKDRLAEVEQIRRRFFSEGGALDSLDPETLLQRVHYQTASAGLLEWRTQTQTYARLICEVTHSFRAWPSTRR